MSPYIRKVPTGSGHLAVQIMAKVKGRQVVLEHLGTAHSDAELAVLMHVAHEHLRADGQLEFDLADGKAAAGRSPDSPVVRSQVSRILWDVLSEAYSFLGFDAVGDEAFKQLVLARLIEPASKVETIRILEEIGVAAPHISTVKRCLGRINERDYRQQIAAACHTRALSRGTLALCLYDVTTLLCRRRHNRVYADVWVMPMTVPFHCSSNDSVVARSA